MAKLVFIRHGQSQWNLENRFTGWVDVPLSSNGREEATQAGKKIADINFDIAFTGTLIRAHETLLRVMAETNTSKIPIFQHSQGKHATWQHHTGNPDIELAVIMDEAINERYYGDLQGLNKDETRAKFGEEQVHIWRRSYSTPPPNGEALKDTLERTLPYYESTIVPYLRENKNVLVVAHGNSIRSITKFLENIPDEEITELEIPTGVPIVYEMDQQLTILEKKILE